MKKEDFKYEDLERNISNRYVFDGQDSSIVIEEDIFDDETVEYASKIAKKYEDEKNSILDFMLDTCLREFYTSNYNYTDEYIKSNIGKPIITVHMKNDNAHPRWKFQYAGIIDFCENKLDEHIISVEFMDDLNLDDQVQMNG